MRLAIHVVLVLGAAAGCAQETRRISDRPPPPANASTPPGPLTKPVLAPLSQPSFAVSDVTERSLAAEPAYAYVSARTTVRELPRAVAAAMAELAAAEEAGRATFVGPATLVYRGMTGELERPFTLEVGFPVPDGTPPSGRVQVRPLPALRAAAVTFAGPVSAIDKAYDRLLPAVAARKLRPTGEAREVYLRWDGPGSAANQILVAVGVR